MRFEIRAMTQEEAEAVAGWHYEPPYDFYDFENEPEDLEELLDQARRKSHYHSVLDEHGVLVGFFSFKQHGTTVEIGLGLRPDLTGKGLGASLIEAGMDFARRELSPETFVLDVALFNRRAKKVYDQAGFRPERRWTNRAGVKFLRMKRPAQPAPRPGSTAR